MAGLRLVSDYRYHDDLVKLANKGLTFEKMTPDKTILSGRPRTFPSANTICGGCLMVEETGRVRSQVLISDLCRHTEGTGVIPSHSRRSPAHSAR